MEDSGSSAMADEDYIEYDADIGIIGFELAVTLARKGFRIRRRSLRKRSIPAQHKISKEDAMNFMKNNYGAEMI